MESSELTIVPSDLLVWLDETGQEDLADPKYPVFGLGGCAVRGSTYLEEMDGPWKEIKDQHFGGADNPLHASGLDVSNTRGVQAIGEFFRRRQFDRFAAIFTKWTALDPPDAPIYPAACRILGQQLGRVVQANQFHRFVLLAESSDRTNKFIVRHMSTFIPILAYPSGPGPAPVERCFVPKSLNAAGLEIADFVVHAAGRQALVAAAGRLRIRKDAEAVFTPSEGRHAELVCLGTVTVYERGA